MRTHYNFLPIVLLTFTLLLCISSVNAATISFVDPTPNDTTNSSATYFYFNVTSNENLNQTYLAWINASGTTNYTMTNSSLHNAYANLTSANTTLSEAIYTYKIWSQNTTGSWNVSGTRTLTIDRTNPTYVNITFNDTFPSNSTNFLVTCYFAENNLRTANLTLYYPNGTVYNSYLLDNFASENKSNTTITTNLESYFTFDLNLTDWADNTGTNSTALMSNGTELTLFLIDNLAPRLNAYSPSSYTSDQNITLSIDLLDRSLNVSSIVLYFNNSEVTPTSNSAITNGRQITYLVTNLDDDTSYSVNISANDTKGHTLSASSGYFTFHVDATAPTAATNFIINNTASQTPTSNYTFNRNNLTLNWTAASDSETYISRYALLMRNRSINQLTGLFGSWTSWYIENSSVLNTSTNYLVENLADDYQYEFNLTAYDAVNNTAKTGTLNSTIDLNAPQISTYANGTQVKYPYQWTNYTNLTVWLNITDISGIDNSSINITFNGTYHSFDILPNTQNQTHYQIRFNVTNLENNKNYTIILYANDTLNQKATLTYNISTDFTTPSSISVANFTAPYSGSGGWYNDSVIWQITCSDALSGIGAYSSNESTYSGSWNSSPNIAIDTDGNYTYLFKCKDQAGNILTTTHKVPVDSESPHIDYSSRTPTGSSVASTADIQINYSDASSGIDTDECILKYKSSVASSYSTVTGSTTGYTCGSHGMLYTTIVYTAGITYTVNVTVHDKVGHSDNEIWSFTIAGGTTQDSSSSSSSSTTTNTTTPTYSLVWQNIPTSVNVVKGKNNTFEIQVKNSGNQLIENIALSLTGGLEKTFNPTQITSLAAGSSKIIEITLNSDENDTVGVYDYTLKAQGDEATATTTLKVKIQPTENNSGTYATDLNDIIEQYTVVKNLLNKANHTVENQTQLTGIVALLTEVDTLLSQANESLASADYAELVQLEKDIKIKLNTAKTTLESLTGGNKVPVWIYIVIPIGVLLIVGIILYFSLVPEDKRLEKKFNVSLPKINFLKSEKKAKQIGEPIPSRIKKLKQEINSEKEDESVKEKEYGHMADTKMTSLKKEIKDEKKQEREQEKELKKLKKEKIRENLGKNFSKLGKKAKKIVKKD